MSEDFNNSLELLLNHAKSATGSDYATAKALGVSRAHVSQWRSGKHACTPEDVAQLAALAGLEADKWLIRAVIAKHEGTAKGDRLNTLFIKHAAAVLFFRL